MENFTQLKSLERKVAKGDLDSTDLEVLKSTLLATTSNNILLKKYSKEDSEKLLLAIQKRNAANIIHQMSYKQKYTSFFSDEVLNALFELFFVSCTFTSSDAFIEFKNVKEEINSVIMKIIKKRSNENIKSKIIDYLHNKADCDYLLINFALLVDRITNIKNKEARRLNARKMDKEFLAVIEKHKGVIIEENLSDIFYTCKSMLFEESSKDTGDEKPGFLLAIISEINPILKEKDLDMINYMPEAINEAYIGFLFCHIVDSESANCVFDVINQHGVLNTIFEMLASAHTYTHPIDESTDPDISFLMFGLKMINKIVFYLPDLLQFFVANCDVFINALWANLNDKILGTLFDFVALLLNDDEVRNKVYDYLVYTELFQSHISRSRQKTSHKGESVYDVFERESKNRKYYFTEGFVRFCSAFVAYKMLEAEIFAFFNVAIESSNPTIVILILEKIGENNFLLNSKILTSIKKGIESDEKICGTFINFVIGLSEKPQKKVISFVTKDVSFLSLIFSISTAKFFQFLYLIDLNEISMFLGEDLLDRINENAGEGLKFLVYASQKNNEFSRFILRKPEFMNMLCGFDELKLQLYNVICENNPNDFEIAIGKSTEKHVFILPEKQTADFYSILSRLVINAFEREGKSKKYVLKDYIFSDDNIESYCRYLKCLIVIEQSVDKEINYLLGLENENEFIGDLASFSNIIRNTTYKYALESSFLQTTLLSNLGSKNNNLFVTKYDSATKFDKYLLFFVIDSENITKEVYEITMKQLYSLTGDLFSDENLLFLRHCLNVLMHYTKLDDAIKFFNTLDINDDFINQVVMLNIINILNDNVEILNMNVLMKASYNLQAKMCFILWLKQLRKNEDIKTWALSLRKHIVDEELDFMVREINKIKC